jgi:ABC-type Mn2+/Zn2+ transport system permease subunit
VNTYRYLFESGDFYWPAVVAAVLIAVLCAVLSVFVTLKRLSFIGQGISHAAFGGVGFVAILGLATAVGTATAQQTLLQYAIIFTFCLLAALAVGFISDKRSQAVSQDNTHADTAIGVVLVASMALGSILSSHSRSGVAWESFLFGSLLNATWTDVAVAAVVTAAVIATLWFFRRPMLFWAFDEPSAKAFGVSARAMKFVLLVLLTLATVTAMKLAGVVLATAMLVLPGATALRLSSRWNTVLILSGLIALAGALGGLILSFEANWLPGASIVATLSIIFFLTIAATSLRKN